MDFSGPWVLCNAVGGGGCPRSFTWSRTAGVSLRTPLLPAGVRGMALGDSSPHRVPVLAGPGRAAGFSGGVGGMWGARGGSRGHGAPAAGGELRGARAPGGTFEEQRSPEWSGRGRGGKPSVVGARGRPADPPTHTREVARRSPRPRHVRQGLRLCRGPREGHENCCSVEGNVSVYVSGCGGRPCFPSTLKYFRLCS